VSCNADEVAMKIKVYYEKYRIGGSSPYLSSNGFAKGISLGCRKLVKK
jgi:predicted  nucleic acid-binding Zn ribbon protein